MKTLDGKQALYDKRTKDPSMETIDISLRYLQMLLVKIKNETGYISEESYSDQYMDKEIKPFVFDDEGSCTIRGIQHMTDKAIIHANHIYENIKKMRGEDELSSTYTRRDDDEKELAEQDTKADDRRN